MIYLKSTPPCPAMLLVSSQPMIDGVMDKNYGGTVSWWFKIALVMILKKLAALQKNVMTTLLRTLKGAADVAIDRKRHATIANFC